MKLVELLNDHRHYHSTYQMDYFITGQGCGRHVFGLYKQAPWFFIPFLFGIVTAGLTAFYMGRVMFLTFWGEPRSRERFEHAHESPWTMTVPLGTLAFASVIAGGLGAIPFFTQKWFDSRLTPERIVLTYMEEKRTGGAPSDPGGEPLLASIAPVPIPREQEETGGEEEHPGGVQEEFEHKQHQAHIPTLLLSLGMLFVGAGGSYYVFAGKWKGRDLPKEIPAIGWYKKVLLNLYYFDWFYYKFFVGGLLVIKTIAGLFDKWIIDGIVNLWAFAVLGLSTLSGWVDNQGVDGLVRSTSDWVLDVGKSTRKVQTGRLQDYVSMSIILFGSIVVIFLIMELLA